MLSRLLKFDYFLSLVFLAGAAQYSLVAYSAIVSGSVTLWTIDGSELNSVGIFRYVKDALIVGVSIAWLFVLPKLHLPRELIRLIKIYFGWLVCVIGIGLVGFFLEYSPLFFLPAGLRWILLMHAAFGVFILSSTLVIDGFRHKFIFRVLLVIVLIDVYATLLQFKYASSAYNLALGVARLTGVFSNAAVAGYFSLAIVLIVSHLDSISLKKRVVVTLICLILALSSGTRLATAAVFFIMLGQFLEVMESGGKEFRRYKKIIFIPIAIAAIFIGYQSLISQVGRGDAISQQFDKGGRAANFLIVVNSLSSAGIGELFFGRGLGIGTNTAIGTLLANGVDPMRYRFNLLIDNSLVTGMFQFGIFGSLVFWYGIWNFISFAKPRYLSVAKSRYLITITIIMMVVVFGNPFEQYFLMMAFSSALGAIYWADQMAFRKMQASRS